MIHDFECAATCPGFRIVGCIDKPGDARVQNSPSAHGAGFEGDVETATGETIVLEGDARRPQRNQFSMARGIVIADDAILSTSENVSVWRNDDRPDGDFARSLGGPGFRNRRPHKVDILFGRHWADSLSGRDQRRSKSCLKWAAAAAL